MATIITRGGQRYTTSLDGAPAGITDWAIQVYEAWPGSGSDPVGAPFTSPIEAIEVGDTGDVMYVAMPLAPSPPDDADLDDNGRTRYTVVWESDGETSDPDVLLVGPAAATGEFASLTDLAIRLGLTSISDLTAAQTMQGTLLLSIASGLIIEAVDRDSDWAATLEPVPLMLRAVCLEVVARVMNNPSGVRSQSETLGAHSYAASYTDGSHGLMLTKMEVTLCRSAVIGQTSGSACVDSLVTTVAETRDVDSWFEATDPATLFEDS